MIIIYHQNNKVVEVEVDGKDIIFSKKNIVKTMFEIAISFPEKLLIWCQLDLKENLNLSKIPEIFHHHKIMASFNVFENAFLSEAIGYVEGTPFINVNKKVSYPTWQMSTSIGGIHTSVLLVLKDKARISDDFGYFLNSLAKVAMPAGLLCYSEPDLLINSSDKIRKQKNSLFNLFRFVKQHFKSRWTFLLFFNLFLHERKLALFPFISSFFYCKRKVKEDVLDGIEVQSTKKVLEKGTVDVIIPTIGRKEYLHDVLKDLSKQSHLPKKVIIVEQNPSLESTSELDYITNQSWPFIIKHTFTHQAGACNARNLALAEVDSEWVFLNDDDNRFEADLIAKTLNNCLKFGSKVASNAYLKVHEIKKTNIVCQAPFFGSGNSFIASVLLEKVSFRMGFEFGYGEDSDFGMQLRNSGADVLYFPNPEITHLSAPIGGFRTKPVLAWKNDSIQPKPSPTVMLYNQLHLTKEQIRGYKTILFFKFYKVQTIKSPIKYLQNFKRQWEQSLYWANELKDKK
ncbi:glycosyltransferase family 2 protein [Flavobacterium sp. LC2016-12]|uniref:glycosyltransferase family 2 protein n=1 Tax=Flavobacterium sp. LC2016-12 TaxID=2783794 RepID=UPI00188AFCA5|nr:glycosyltransferase family A protein [Flavobacterium sp. LC2016-12]MBF4465640.1 glycosyltransferase family 2 protein [Flavobacterium sp. LC2016-12]